MRGTLTAISSTGGFLPAVLAGCLWAGAAVAQERPSAPIPGVDDFTLDGRVGEWRARPLDRVLPAAEGIPQALVWVGQVAEGLVVAAEIRSGVARSERATLRIGLAGTPELPPVGWGHQFGFVNIEEPGDCAGREFGNDVAACESWLERQLAWREALPRLFRREWRVELGDPPSVVEAAARPYFDGLPPEVRERVLPLDPGGRPRVESRSIQGTEGGLGLEFLIPWSSFPPVRAPRLDTVRLAVDWLDPDVGAEDGLAEDDLAEGGELAWAESLPARTLASPLEHTVTPCGYGLEGLLIPGGEDIVQRTASEQAVPYMIPEPSGDLRRLIVLDNEAAGYQYDPAPEALSPAAFEAVYEVLDVGRDERLCGPLLAFARGGERASSPDWTVTGEGDPYGRQVDLGELDVRRLDDGGLLVTSGPRVRWSYYGSGQCGMCPRVGLDLFHVDAETGEISVVFEVTEVADLGDIEIEISEDRRRITVYRSDGPDFRDEEPPRWRSTTFCAVEPAEGGAPSYAKCEEAEDVPEPPDRLRRRYRSDG